MRVVNASPLVHLSRLSLLELLRKPHPDGEVVFPLIVLDEVMRGAAHDPAARLVAQATSDWLRVEHADRPHPLVNRRGLDRGEIAVLSVALEHPGATVVLDDLAARREADRLKIEETGTLGLLLMGKELGIVPSVYAVLETLRQQGMRLSHEVIRAVLDEAGE
jgi:uncharacterized protein